MSQPCLWNDPDAFAAHVRQLPARVSGVPRAVFLVTPVAFHLAAESARDNAYMQMAAGVDAGRALAQHLALAQLLARAGIPVPALLFWSPEGVLVFESAAGRPLAGATAVTMHWGVNRWTQVVDTPMSLVSGKWQSTGTRLLLCRPRNPLSRPRNPSRRIPGAGRLGS